MSFDDCELIVYVMVFGEICVLYELRIRWIYFNILVCNGVMEFFKVMNVYFFWNLINCDCGIEWVN